MLDGLLGRGSFSSKCKSLIKLTRTRIDVIRRKRGATQKFLKKDIADLLANGLEQNAFGRVEGLFSELILSSCYDFIDHVCDIILKHLSTMQKQRECLEDCMEAVASLMFAAARFSDLPELRDLRDIFQERYGNSVEHKVNQQLVEHISPKPPAKEQKLQLLQDVASEFSMNFDAMAFDRRISAAEGHNQPKIHAPPPDAAHKYLAPRVEEHVQNKEKDGSWTEKRDHEMNIKFSNGQDLRSRIPRVPETGNKRENLEFLERERGGGGGSVGPINPNKVKVELVVREKRGDKRHDHQERAKESSSTFSERRLDALPSKGEKFVEPSPSYDLYNQDNSVVIPPRKLPGNDAAVGSKLKLKNSMSLPPPYVKPGRTKHRHKEPEFQSNGENNDTLSHDSFKRAQQSNAPGNSDVKVSGFTEVYYKDDSTPRRRSRRRRTKSSVSSPDNNGVEEEMEEVRVVRRVATSRRRNEASKKGLQIVFDDDQSSKPRDDEEKILDKMLLHYSKKDRSGEVDRSPPRRKDRSEPLKEKRESSGHRSRGRERVTREVADDDGDDDEGVSQHSSRSFSLPREQMSSTASETKTKVFTRAASFDQDTSTPAKHVHPKLPNYDDLAARFAALRRDRE